MGGRRSRNKGARGEREVIGLLQPVVDAVCEEKGQPRLVLRRNADQRWAEKQYDLIGVPWVALEIKRVENLGGRGSWWKQVLAATGKNQYPVLAYRQNHQKWTFRVRVPVRVNSKHVRITVEMAEREFLAWFRVKSTCGLCAVASAAQARLLPIFRTRLQRGASDRI